MKYTIEYFKKRGVIILDHLPSGWQRVYGATTAPSGYYCAHNSRDIFGDEYKHALIKL